jgi:hypothetical protein
MHISRSEVADTAMVVAVTVPGEKVAAPTAGNLNGRKALWVVRTVLHGLELRLAVRIIVWNPRPGVTFVNPQVIEEFSHATRHHGCTSISVQAELFWLDAFSLTASANEFTSDSFRFPSGNSPTHHLTAKDVHDGIEVVEHASTRTRQPGDIPGPALVWLAGLQAWNRIVTTPSMPASAPFTQETVVFKQSVHLPDAAEIDAFVQKGVEDLGRRKVIEAFWAQSVQDR